MPAIGIDKNWWDVVRMVAERSSEQNPFATLLAILSAIIILALGPLVIWRVGRYFEMKMKYRRDFDQIRNSGSLPADPTAVTAKRRR